MNLIKITKINPHIEEEITVDVKNIVLTCFLSNYLRELHQGESYQAELNLFSLDDYDLTESLNGKEQITQIENSYRITGILKDNYILCKEIKFNVENLSDEYSYLNEHMVTLNADRIDIDFDVKVDHT